MPDCRDLAVEPPVDGPMPGISVGWDPHRERDGDWQRELRRELRQPSMFLCHLRGVPLGARQSHGHVLAEMKGPVVPPVELNWFDRQVGPLRKLRFDQFANERWTDLHVIDMLLTSAQACLLDLAGITCGMRTKRRQTQAQVPSTDGYPPFREIWTSSPTTRTG